MSEPMSSVEIEDVLSSIRRLVSDDLRPAKPQGQTAQAAMPASAEAASKLILTPSLRVVPGEGEFDPMPVAAAQPVDALAPDTVEDLPLTQWTESDWTDAEPAGFVALDGYDQTDAPVVLPMSFGTVTADPLPADTALEDEADLAELQPADASPDPASTAMEAAFAAEPQPDLQADMAASDDALADELPDDAWVEMSAPDITPPQDWQDALPEAQPEPEAPEMADPVEEDRHWADAAEAEVLRQLSADAESAAAAHFADSGDDGPVYDEQLLRDLVRDIIREELQGTLGERITRNVRKLVRAEIARAMALREFE